MVPAHQSEGLSFGSHKVVDVVCDFAVSDKCRKAWKYEWKTVVRFRKTNSGKDICLYCSRQLKFMGRTNPNCRYKNVDDNWLNELDTEEKAYFLGLIAADGSISESGITLSLQEPDRHYTTSIRDLIDSSIPLIPRVGVCPNGAEVPMVGFTVNSRQLAKDACRHLKTPPGKKDSVIQMPDIQSEQLKWAFVRGFFDGDGFVRSPTCAKGPRCGFASNSRKMLDSIRDLAGSTNTTANKQLEFNGAFALDFMAKLYENASPHLRMPRKYENYLEWCLWSPCLTGGGNSGNNGFFHWTKTIKEAVAPSKARVSDSGYDLTLIKKVKETPYGVEFYDTGIKIQPPFGWYFDLVPRSSISKTGYMLANSVGVIDRSYVGSVLVPLRKIDKNAPDLELPNRLVQIVPRPIVHFQVVEVDSLDDTDRGEGGFGSTGK